MKGKGLTFIPNTEVAKIIMMEAYNQFVKEGVLVPIEELSVEEKMELVNECREMKEIFYTNESLIIDSKTLHTIKLINNNS